MADAGFDSRELGGSGVRHAGRAGKAAEVQNATWTYNGHTVEVGASKDQVS